MNPIYYKSRKSGELFMLEIMTKDLEQIDGLLDEFNDIRDRTVEITQEQFENAYPRYMVADLYDEDGIMVIGKWYGKYIELSDEPNERT